MEWPPMMASDTAVDARVPPEVAPTVPDLRDFAVISLCHGLFQGLFERGR
jgi:hypothetical protein